MTQNMTVGCQMNGYSTVMMIVVASTPYQVKDSGEMMTGVATGDQF
jgi:hypothetical protein